MKHAQLNDVRETAKSASPGLMKLLIISFFLDGGCMNEWSSNSNKQYICNLKK